MWSCFHILNCCWRQQLIRTFLIYCASNVFAVYIGSLGYSGCRRRQTKSRGCPDEFSTDSWMSSKFIYLSTWYISTAVEVAVLLAFDKTVLLSLAFETGQVNWLLLLSCWWPMHMDNLPVRIGIFTSGCVNVGLLQLTESWHNRYGILLNWLALQILHVQSTVKFVSSGTCTQWWNADIFVCTSFNVRWYLNILICCNVSFLVYYSGPVHNLI